MTTLHKTIIIALAIVLPWFVFNPVERLFFTMGNLISPISLSFATGLVFMLYVMWDMFCLGLLIHVVGNSLNKQLEKVK